MRVATTKKDLVEYPENDKFLWKEARNQIVLNVHHPLFLMKLLTNAARVDSVPSEKTTLTVCIILRSSSNMEPFTREKKG